MKFQLALLAPIIALFVASADVAHAATSATTCVSNCFGTAATSVGCAASDVACVKQAQVAFQTTVQECLEVNTCTSLADGTQAELDAASATVALRTALLPEFQYDGMLEDENATILARVVPRSSLTERACNSGDNLCVLSASRCNTYCRRCHEAGSGCRDCSEGICAGFLGLTCVCQTPCTVC